MPKAGASKRANAAEVALVREVFGLSQRDLARAMNVAPLTVARWESAKGPHPTGLQNEVVRVLHRTAVEVRRRNDPDLARTVGTTIAVGIGALLLGALLAEVLRARERMRERNACECGGEMREQTYVHVEQVGAFKVKDGTMQLLQCEKCGNVEITLDELAGYQRRAAAAALREAPKVDGAMVKYARRALGFKQTELAELLGCASETLSRWETDTAPIPRAEQLAIVAILDGVELDAELYDVEPGSPEAFKRAKRRGTALSVRAGASPLARRGRERRERARRAR